MKWILQRRKLLWTVNLALLATLGYIASGLLTNNDTEQGQLTTIPANSTKTDPEVAIKSPESADNNLILQRNIFATVTTEPKKETPKPAEPEPMPTLNLKLLATIAGDQNFARAVIQNTKTKKQNLYKTGDVIEGAKIQLIERNTITIAFAGNEQILNISTGETPAAIAKTQAPSATESMINFAKTVNIASPTQREIYRNSEFVRNGGISAAFKAFQTIPTEIDDKTKGLKITGLENNSLAKHIGLKNGDIITKINGQTPTNNRKAFQIMRSARKRSKLNLELLQNKKQKKLSFKMI